MEHKPTTTSPSSPSVYLPSKSGTEKRKIRHSESRHAKGLTCHDASTQILVATQNCATQVDKMVVSSDKATSVDKRMFYHGIKQESLTFHLDSNLDGNVFCRGKSVVWMGIDDCMVFTAEVPGAQSSSSEGSSNSMLHSCRTSMPFKSSAASPGRKAAMPDTMSHKEMETPTSEMPTKSIEPSQGETNSPQSHSPSQPLVSDKQPMASTLKRNTHLKHLEVQHLNNPKRALAQGLEMLESDDWEETRTGLNIINRVVQSHPDILVPKLHDFCLTLVSQVKNLRSYVSRVAVSTLGNMYTHLQKKMDPELEVTATALLHKVGTANEFIRQDIDAALDSMVQNCSASFVLKALLAEGLRHLNSTVRKCASQHLLKLVERTDAARLLSDTKGVTDCILPTAARLAKDASQEVRHFGRQMLIFMAPHPDFDKMLRKYIPVRDHQEIREIVKRAQECVKTQTSSPLSHKKSTLPDCGVNPPAAKAKQYSMSQREEYIDAMKIQMASKDFQQRMAAIDKIVGDCKEKPDLVLACKYPVFDAIVARLQESNRKVNQHTLEALQAVIPLLKDGLAQVMNILVPAIVENHLNSKIAVIHNAADSALNSLIQHQDNTLLLEVLCIKAQILSGTAKGHLIDKLAGMVTDLYPRQPQTVEQKVLPLLWKLLLSSQNRAPTASLCQALYTQMGQRLKDFVAPQSIEVNKALNHLLR